jgi:hypothetical protein
MSNKNASALLTGEGGAQKESRRQGICLFPGKKEEQTNPHGSFVLFGSFFL